MPSVPFLKTTACGNDFLIVDGKHAPADIVSLSTAMCHRTLGIGADGVEWLFPDPQADVRARLLNADGSDAEISGNGTRCVAASLIAATPNLRQVRIRTGAGIRTCTLLERQEQRFQFETNMGEPQIGDPFSVKLAFAEVIGIPVSMGNPHFAVFLDEFLPGWQAEAAEIAKHHDFKHGVNVEFVRVVSRNEIEIHIFERGAGETQSSGTGSCASAVAAIATGRADSPLRVITPGGIQTVRWEGEVSLSGPAQIVCRGEFYF